MIYVRISVETNGETFNFEIGKKYNITTYKGFGFQETRTYYTNVIVSGVSSQYLYVKNTDENNQFGRYPDLILNEIGIVEEVEE